jgi:hypothetical protein
MATRGAFSIAVAVHPPGIRYAIENRPVQAVRANQCESGIWTPTPLQPITRDNLLQDSSTHLRVIPESPHCGHRRPTSRPWTRRPIVSEATDGVSLTPSLPNGDSFIGVPSLKPSVPWWTIWGYGRRWRIVPPPILIWLRLRNSIRPCGTGWVPTPIVDLNYVLFTDRPRELAQRADDIHLIIA